MTEPVFVVELEGALFRIGQRLHLRQAGLWDDFEEAFESDIADTETVDLINALSHNFSVVIWSTRYERYRVRTQNQLKKAGITGYDMLLMRPDLDFMPKSKETELKGGFLDQLTAEFHPSLYNLIILDCKDEVLDMARNAGHQAWHVIQGIRNEDSSRNSP